MLHEFLTFNRTELIARCAAKAAARFPPDQLPAAEVQGVPIFLEKLAEILRREQLTSDRPEAGAQVAPGPTAIGADAALHGADLLRRGFSVDQVVHGYGDVCQSVTELAVEREEGISADEFRTLNRCLDDAIADAVTAYGSVHQRSLKAQASALSESLSDFSTRQRELIATALHAFSALKTGQIGLNGVTGTLLFHALQGLDALARESGPEIRLASALTTLPPS